MKIAVMSDSHDNIWKLDQALPFLEQAEAVIHCGDLVAPFMLKRLGRSLNGKPFHMVWGNNDGDRYLLGKVAGGFQNIELHGVVARLELGGLRVAVIHYPPAARGLALSGEYDLVSYGHDHKAHEAWMGKCLLLNPGELMGLEGRSSLALVDLPSRDVEWVDL